MRRGVDYPESGAVPVVIGSKNYGCIPVVDILPQERRTNNREDYIGIGKRDGSKRSRKGLGHCAFTRYRAAIAKRRIPR